MIQSNIRLYILSFQKNDLKPKVLIHNNTQDIPTIEIVGIQPIDTLIKKTCDDYGIAYQDGFFKIADCQIMNDRLNIVYYCILPFGYSNPLLRFIDLSYTDLSSFPNLKKIINLL